MQGAKWNAVRRVLEERLGQAGGLDAVFPSKTKEQVEASSIRLLAPLLSCTHSPRGMKESNVQRVLTPQGPAQHTLAYSSTCV